MARIEETPTNLNDSTYTKSKTSTPIEESIMCIDWKKYFEKCVCPTDTIKDSTTVIRTEIVPQEIKPTRDIEKLIASLQVKVTTKFDVNKNLFQGNAQDLNKYLAKTPLAGHGQDFIDAQEKYGVNALFLMSIAKVESQYGKSPAKDKVVHKYNVFGLRKGKAFQDPKSYSKNIDDAGSALDRIYIKAKVNPVTTIDKISKRYCTASSAWAKKIIDEMNNISSFILKNL